MKVVIKTEVVGYYLEIMRGFDRKLFEALKPKNADMEIVEFTGSKKGDLVKLKFNKPIAIEWTSVITEHGENKKEAWFIDEGTVLPYPLKKWRHKHRVLKINDSHSYIIDEMNYECVNPLITIILKPFVYLAFYPRKKVYQQYFNNFKPKEI